jgi:hypothetical protein
MLQGHDSSTTGAEGGFDAAIQTLVGNEIKRDLRRRAAVGYTFRRLAV